MARPESDKRKRLVNSAVRLAYRQGFARTTLAEIAADSDVPLGNVYYYFKTKESLGEAIIAYRAQQFAHMRERLAEMPDPRQRLAAFVDMTVANADNVAQKGCPFGSLCAELLKIPGDLAGDSNVLFAEPMDWLAEQFAALGRGEAAEALALQLQSSLQGASLMAQSFRDASLLEREGARLKAWVERMNSDPSA